MTTVPNQARKLLITAMKSDITYRMMMMSARQQLALTKKQSITEEKNLVTNNKLNELMESGVENITWAQYQEVQNATAKYDNDLTMLELQDERYESEMRMLETKLQQLEAEETELDKTINNSIKKEFNVFGNNN